MPAEPGAVGDNSFLVALPISSIVIGLPGSLFWS
jgi:hypothetical protein